MGEIQLGLAVVVVVFAAYGFVWKVNPSAALVTVLYTLSFVAVFAFFVGAMIYEHGVNKATSEPLDDCQLANKEQLDSLIRTAALTGELTDDRFELFGEALQARANQCIFSHRMSVSAVERFGFFLIMAACFILPQMFINLVVTHTAPGTRKSEQEEEKD